MEKSAEQTEVKVKTPIDAFETPKVKEDDPMEELPPNFQTTRPFNSELSVNNPLNDLPLSVITRPETIVNEPENLMDTQLRDSSYFAPTFGSLLRESTTVFDENENPMTIDSNMITTGRFLLSKDYDVQALVHRKVMSKFQALSLDAQINARFNQPYMKENAHFMRYLATDVIHDWNGHKNKLYQWFFQLFVAKGQQCQTCHRWFGNTAYYHLHVSQCAHQRLTNYRLPPPQMMYNLEPYIFCLLCRPSEMNFFKKTHRNEAILWIHMRFHHTQNFLAQLGYQRAALELAIQYSQARSSSRKGIQSFNPVQFKHYDFMLKGLLYTDAHPLLTPTVLKNIPTKENFLTKGHTLFAPRYKQLPMVKNMLESERRDEFRFNEFMQNEEDLNFDHENVQFQEGKLYRLVIPFASRRNTPVHLTMRWYDTRVTTMTRQLLFYEEVYKAGAHLQGILIPQKWERCGPWAIAFYQPVGRSLDKILEDNGFEPRSGDPILLLQQLKHIVMADLVEAVRTMKLVALYSGHITPENIFLHTKTNNVFVGEIDGVRETETWETIETDFPYYERSHGARKMTLLAEIRAATMVGLQMTAGLKNVILSDKYQNEQNQEGVVLKLIQLLKGYISEAEEQAIRRIFFNDAIAPIWQAFLQLGQISAQFIVKDMQVFRKLKSIQSFRISGVLDTFDPALPFDISKEEQANIQEMNFEDMLLQGHFTIAFAQESANENLMDCLPRNIHTYTEY